MNLYFHPMKTDLSTIQWTLLRRIGVPIDLSIYLRYYWLEFHEIYQRFWDILCLARETGGNITQRMCLGDTELPDLFTPLAWEGDVERGWGEGRVGGGNFPHASVLRGFNQACSNGCIVCQSQAITSHMDFPWSVNGQDDEWSLPVVIETFLMIHSNGVVLAPEKTAKASPE